MFRRLAIPAYTGGLPAGYEYLNNAVAGTPAAAHGAITEGNNIGSLFLGHLEGAESRAVNRGLKALGENTDHLDDLLRRDMAVTTRTDSINGSGETFYVLPAGTYLGRPGFATPELLFRMVDGATNDEISNGAGAHIRVSSVTLSGGDVLGGGFSQNTVRVNFNAAIPAPAKYRIHYGTRSNLATALTDALVGFDLLVGTIGTTFTAQKEIRAIKGGPTTAWLDVPLTTLYDLAWGGLNERAWRKTTRDADIGDTRHPVNPLTLNTPGSGSYIRKSTGPGLISYNSENLAAVGTLWPAEHHLAAAVGVDQRSGYAGGAVNDRYSAVSGFVHLGGLKIRQDDRSGASASIFGFFDGGRYDLSGSIATAITNIPRFAACTLNSSSLTLGVGWFRSAGQTAIVLGVTIVRVIEVATAIIHTFVIHSFTADNAAVLRYLDGTTPNFAAATSCQVVDWVQPTFFTAPGADAERASGWGAAAQTQLHGALFLSPRAMSTIGASRTLPVRVVGHDDAQTLFQVTRYSMAGVIEDPARFSVRADGFMTTLAGLLVSAGSATFNSTVGLHGATTLDSNMDVLEGGTINVLPGAEIRLTGVDGLLQSKMTMLDGSRFDMEAGSIFYMYGGLAIMPGGIMSAGTGSVVNFGSGSMTHVLSGSTTKFHSGAVLDMETLLFANTGGEVRIGANSTLSADAMADIDFGIFSSVKISPSVERPIKTYITPAGSMSFSPNLNEASCFLITVDVVAPMTLTFNIQNAKPGRVFDIMFFRPDNTSGAVNIAFSGTVTHFFNVDVPGATDPVPWDVPTYVGAVGGNYHVWTGLCISATHIVWRRRSYSLS